MVGVLRSTIPAVRTDARISTICQDADAQILEATSRVYNKQKGMLKGIAFPTAVSVNNILCHAAPSPGEPADVALKAGDLVKMYGCPGAPHQLMCVC